jgi:hypothetical protein
MGFPICLQCVFHVFVLKTRDPFLVISLTLVKNWHGRSNIYSHILIMDSLIWVENGPKNIILITRVIQNSFWLSHFHNYLFINFFFFFGDGAGGGHKWKKLLWRREGNNFMKMFWIKSFTTNRQELFVISRIVRVSFWPLNRYYSQFVKQWCHLWGLCRC